MLNKRLIQRKILIELLAAQDFYIKVTYPATYQSIFEKSDIYLEILVKNENSGVQLHRITT